MATKKAKPNGQFLLTDEEAAAFLSEREVSDLPGKYQLIIFVTYMIIKILKR